VWFIDCNNWPEFRQDNTPLITSGPTTCQCFWSKIGGIPSSPRDLEGAICLIACSTSHDINSFRRELFIVSEITPGTWATASSIWTGWAVVNKFS
jgi:hypothetical protein